MHTFLTPDPITIEIRNAAGDIRLDFADVTTTTVEVTASSSHPFGFLDDVIRAVGGGRQSERRAFSGRRRFDAGGTGFHPGPDQGPDSGFDKSYGAGPFDFGGDSADDPVERVRVEFRDGSTEASGDGGDGRAARATLIVDTDPARDGWRSSFVVHVTAPNASGVRVQSQSADVTATGEADRLETRTASGDIKIDRVLGRTVVQTASGDVIINATGDCDVRTASGDIEIHHAAADALLHSTSGDIRVDRPTGNVSARSVSGDIRLVDAVSGRAEAIAVSGDVEIGIHPGSLASVELSTISGNTDTDFEVSDRAPEDDAPVLDIRVKTTSGDIRLRRAVTV